MNIEMWWVWMGLATIFLIGEILGLGSFLLWVSFGAAAAGILALVEVSVLGQVLVFINVSGILFVLERRFSERFAIKQPPELSTGRFIGEEGVVIKTIDNKSNTGIVRFGENEWRANSETGEVIPKGTRLRLVLSKDNPGNFEVEVVARPEINKKNGSILNLDGAGHQQPFDKGKNENVFQKTGSGWEIKYMGQSYAIKSSIGLYHIRNLIIKKGEWINCSELKRISSEEISEEKYDPYNYMTKEQLESENLRITEDISPEEIIRQLPLNKIKMLQEELYKRKEADDFNSPEEKIDKLNMLNFIEKYLNSVTDKKGKSRKLYDATDTDRKAVSAAINRCRNSLVEHKELYTHFKSFIKAEGNSFRYMPDRPIDWKTN